MYICILVYIHLFESQRTARAMSPGRAIYTQRYMYECILKSKCTCMCTYFYAYISIHLS